MQNFEIGDIVLVSDIEKPKEKKNEVRYHPFIIVDKENNLVSMDFYGFLISSNKNKNKDKSDYKYNEPIFKNANNNLSKDGHVKCDVLYQFNKNYIVMKIGSVDIADFLRFLNAFEEYQEKYEKKTKKNTQD